MNIKTTDINWQEYRKELEASLSNERLWALGTTGNENPHLHNIEEIEKELNAIDNADYETVIGMHEDTPGYFDEHLAQKEEIKTIQEARKQLQKRISELRSAYNELHNDIEWAGLTESYEKASAVYRSIENMESIINKL